MVNYSQTWKIHLRPGLAWRQQPKSLQLLRLKPVLINMRLCRSVGNKELNTTNQFRRNDSLFPSSHRYGFEEQLQRITNEC